MGCCTLVGVARGICEILGGFGYPVGMKFLVILLIQIAVGNAFGALVISIDSVAAKKNLRKVVEQTNREKFDFVAWSLELKKLYPTAADHKYIDTWVAHSKKIPVKGKFIFNNEYIEVFLNDRFYGRITDIDGEKATFKFKGHVINLKEKSLVAFHRSLVNAMTQKKQAMLLQDLVFSKSYALAIGGYGGAEMAPTMAALGAIGVMSKFAGKAQAATPEQHFEELYINSKDYCPEGEEMKYGPTYYPNHLKMARNFWNEPRLKTAEDCKTLSAEYYLRYKDEYLILPEREYRVSKICYVAAEMKSNCPSLQTAEASTKTVQDPTEADKATTDAAATNTPAATPPATENPVVDPTEN